MKISLFLGAGASVPFGMPTTKKFKEMFLETYSTDDHIRKLLEKPDFEDIEHVLRSIDDLKKIEKFGKHILDFIVENERMQSISILSNIDTLEKNIHKHVYDFYDSDNIENLSRYDWIFQLLNKYNQSYVTDIFTTNYDQIIEKYVKSKNEHIQLHDGFEFDEIDQVLKFSSKNFVENKTEKMDVNLYKLHGSLNWKKEADDIVRVSKDYQYPKEEDNLIIYPTLNPKDGLDLEPFGLINKEFKNKINEADVLIVIGCSFRDEPINDIFQEFSKSGKSIIVISPTASKDIESCQHFGNVHSNDRIILSDYFVEGNLDASISNDQWLKICRKLHQKNNSLFIADMPWDIHDMQSIICELL